MVALRPHASGRREADAWIVKVTEDLDLATVEPVRRAVASALDQATRAVILDMAACDFVDLTGYVLVRALVRCADERRISLFLHDVQPSVARTLLRLDALYADRDEGGSVSARITLLRAAS